MSAAPDSHLIIRALFGDPERAADQNAVPAADEPLAAQVVSVGSINFAEAGERKLMIFADMRITPDDASPRRVFDTTNRTGKEVVETTSFRLALTVDIHRLVPLYLCNGSAERYWSE